MKNTSLKQLNNFLTVWCCLMAMVYWYDTFLAEPELGAIQHIQRLFDDRRIITTVTCTKAEVTIYSYKPQRYENGPVIHVEAVDTLGNVLEFPLAAYRRLLPDSLFYPAKN